MTSRSVGGNAVENSALGVKASRPNCGRPRANEGKADSGKAERAYASHTIYLVPFRGIYISHHLIYHT